ncbi:MAG: dihydrodipicolinate reductase [Pyrinomonadaceae bacterium]|nr:dihydrodipicolinate reductase [Pyrinomonadaceae bacterium]
MKIAIIGYGAMGQLIETLADKKKYEVTVTVDEAESNLTASELADELRSADVAIDFSVAAAVRKNVEASCLAGISLVEGATGWNNELDEIRELISTHNGSFVFGANFSIGVNLFYRVVDQAAEIFAKFETYEAFIEEQHHSRKVDSPSGTALKLKSIVAEHIKDDFTVTATRAGNMPGTHRVGFDGNADQILLEHFARSREGFASGALLAAEWVVGKKGFWEFTEVMDEILKR